MSPSLDYDTEAADLVARTLRAVAADTDVADRDEAAVPIASMPAPVDLGARRSRRLPRTLVATAAAAAVLVAALVWAGRDPSAPSGTPDLGTATDSTVPDGAATPGTDLTPAEIVPGYTAGLAARPDPLTSTGVLHLAQAYLMEPPGGGEILSVVVTWPDGYVPNDGEVGRVATALAMMTGTEATTRSTAVPGEIAGYVTLPIGDVDPALVETVHEVLIEEGVGVQRFARDSGWGVQDVDVSWVPGVAPTVGRRYGDGEASLDVYTAFGDIAGAEDMTRRAGGRHPLPGRRVHGLAGHGRQRRLPVRVAGGARHGGGRHGRRGRGGRGARRHRVDRVLRRPPWVSTRTCARWAGPRRAATSPGCWRWPTSSRAWTSGRA